jgi:signal transduction histidine kinase
MGSRYCLSLMHCDEPIALLYHYFPPGLQPQATQVDYLNALAPTMAIALDGARPQRTAALRAEATHEERARIARDLHDTLGQSLGYLHLKLDQISDSDALKEIVEIRRELERMRAVADESYQQVRRTVSELHHPAPSGLMAALQERGRAMGERGGFEVEFFSEGQERPLAPQVQKHLLYFAGEALSNVEKHAEARQVGLYLLWAEDHLSLILSDDGKGFDPNTCATNGHFGLNFMDERAREIGGELHIISSPGSGTDVILLIPTATPIAGDNGSGP